MILDHGPRLLEVLIRPNLPLRVKLADPLPAVVLLESDSVVLVAHGERVRIEVVFVVVEVGLGPIALEVLIRHDVLVWPVKIMTDRLSAPVLFDSTRIVPCLFVLASKLLLGKPVAE